MRAAKRILILIASMAVMCSVAPGYYYWVFFANRTGPFVPVPMRFDLNALPGSTVSYFISDQAPGPLAPGDDLTGMLSEVQAAASVWNGVTTSALRLQFGGVTAIGAPQVTAGIDVVFDDNMPPGILAQSRPTTVSDLSLLGRGATFVPIVRSRLQFRKDLTNPVQSSRDDAFFLTAVHEFGHTLGLQHTITSSVMSTAITRATTKAAPLSADDIAGISLLYPANGFASTTGSVSGQVTLGGAGVNLASVVALSTSGVAVSGMTNPDGTYRIDGIPPGQYYIYVQPLPPAQQGEATAANIVWPVDAAQNPFPANTSFGAQFFPGTREWTQAVPVGVFPANTVTGVNFSVQPRSGPAVANMQTYAYLGIGGQVPVAAPSLSSGTRVFLVFFADGTVVNNAVAPGLSISAIGGAGQTEAATLAYNGSGSLRIVVDANPVAAPTPVALAVTLNNDLYVLPAAFTAVPSGPPVISFVAPGVDGAGNRTAVINGANLNASSRILFDGMPSSLLATNADGSVVVAPPPGPGGYSAIVEALGSDGQTSLQQLGTNVPPQFTYDPAGAPAIVVNSTGLIAGTDALVEIDGLNTNFVDGQTVVGFGSSDIAVLRTSVVSPTRVLVNVRVNPQILPGLTSVTVATGLQLTTLGSILQIRPAASNQITLRTPIMNQVTGLAGVPVGGFAVITALAVPQNLTGWTLTIGGLNATFFLGAPGVILAQVPPGLPAGPAVVQLISPVLDVIPPVVMQVDPPPPVIAAAVSALGVPIDVIHPASAGDTITLTVGGLSDLPVSTLLSKLQVSVGGVAHSPLSVIPSVSQPGMYLIQVVLASNAPFGPQTPVVVTCGTRVSASYAVAIRVH